MHLFLKLFVIHRLLGMGLQMCHGMTCLVVVLGMRFTTLNLVIVLSLDLLIRRVFPMHHFMRTEGIYLIHVLECKLS